MKYKVGDILLVKDITFRTLLHPHPPPYLHIHFQLVNTLGIITAVEKHSDIFKRGSTENDNGYIWYSQVDGREYYFCEDEVDGEVFK